MFISKLNLFSFWSFENIQYVRPECVELAFYGSSKKISTRYNYGSPNKSMCANENLDVAFSACCTYAAPQPFATNLCKFDVERTTYATSQSRCQIETSGDTCDWYGIDIWSSSCSSFLLEENWHWTNQDCVMKVKGKSYIFYVLLQWFFDCVRG